MIGFNNTTWASLCLSGVTCHVTISTIMFKYNGAILKTERCACCLEVHTAHQMLWLVQQSLHVATLQFKYLS